MAGGWFDILRKTIGWKSAKTVERATEIDAETRYNATDRTTFARVRPRTTIAEATDRGTT